jgi:hypothetical protein
VSNRTPSLYELIRGDEPVKLYVDLEMKRSKSKTMIHDSIHYKKGFDYLVKDQLVQFFSVSEAEAVKLSDSLMLDSSTSEKMSCHLIYECLIFKNVAHAGAFIRSCYAEINNQEVKLLLEGEHAETTYGCNFLVEPTDKSNNQVLSILDACVYSKL